MQKLTKSIKKDIYSMFARGENCERVAEATQVDLRRVKNQYLRYLDLPLGEKLRTTLLPESVANRIHRLADDIKDIARIDALLPAADEKALVSLLDIKRKIKERMMKELIPAPGAASNTNAEISDEIEEYYNKIFGDTDSG